jgi:hypothetical protein
VIVCHCRQCARWSGYAVAATAVPTDRFTLLSGVDSLKWHRSSDDAERGFCAECGSSLFWRPADGSRMSVLAGALDPPTGLKVGAHIFVESKSDYYDICDGANSFPRSAGELARAPDKD